MNELPCVSILSAFKESKNMVKIVVESILSQDYPNVEHIIIDSESKDGTVELLKEYDAKYTSKKYGFIWKSEPDKSMVEGYNKATKLITGDYFLILTNPFVNSGSLSLLMKNLLSGDYDGVCGGCIFQRDGVVVRRWSGKKGNWRLGWMASNETLCLRTKILKEHGGFREQYKGGFDYDFQVRVLSDKSIKIKCVAQPIIYFFAGGASNGSIADNINSIKHSYDTLKDNNVKFAWFTLLCKCVIAFCAYTFASRENISHELEKLQVE